MNAASQKEPALLLLGHGSHLNPNSSDVVFAHAKRLREEYGIRRVYTAFWKEEPAICRVLDGIGESNVVVTPVFMTRGYFTENLIPRELRIPGMGCHRVDGKLLRYTAPIGEHPSLADVVLQRADEAGARGDEALVVLGHGTTLNRNSETTIYRQTDYVRMRGRFPEVRTLFLDQEPCLDQVFDLVRDRDIVVVPFFAADGWHVGQTIPEDLGLGDQRVQRRIRYGSAVGTHGTVADVIRELMEEALSWK